MLFISEVYQVMKSMNMMSVLNSIKDLAGLVIVSLSLFMVGSVQAEEHKCPMKDGKHQVKKFEKMDENKDGSVTKAEFDAMHQAHFVKMDQNKDGAISSDEMKAFHEAMHAEHHEKVQEKIDAKKVEKIDAVKQ